MTGACGWLFRRTGLVLVCPFPSDLLRSPCSLGTGRHRWLASTADWASSCPQAHRGAHCATAAPGQDDVCSPISPVGTGAASPEGPAPQTVTLPSPAKQKRVVHLT